MRFLIFIFIIFLQFFPVSAQNDDTILLDPDFFINNHITRIGTLNELRSKMDKYVFYIDFWFTHPLQKNQYIIRIDDDLIDEFPDSSNLEIIDGTIMLSLPFFDGWTPGILLDYKQEHLYILGGGDFDCFNAYYGIFLTYKNIFKLSLGNCLSYLPYYEYDNDTDSYYFTSMDNHDYYSQYENIDINLSLYNFGFNSLYDFSVNKLLRFAINYWGSLFNIDWNSYLKYIDITRDFFGGIGFEKTNWPVPGFSLGGGLQLTHRLPIVNVIDLHGTIPMSNVFLLHGGISYIVTCYESSHVFGFQCDLRYNVNGIKEDPGTWMGAGISWNYSDYLEKWPFPGELILDFKIHTHMTKNELSASVYGTTG